MNLDAASIQLRWQVNVGYGSVTAADPRLRIHTPAQFTCLACALLKTTCRLNWIDATLNACERGSLQLC